MTRQVVLREPNDYEMIEAFQAFLKKQKLIRTSRDCICPANNTPFACDTLMCQKVTLLSSSDSPMPGRRYLTLWISQKVPVTNPSPNIKLGRLYLIEACNEEDKNGVDGLLGFSALRFLLSLEYTRRALAGPLNCPELLNEEGSGIWRRSKQFYEVQASLQIDEFDHDPIGFLSERGAAISERRKIEFIYRRRWGTYNASMIWGTFLGFTVYEFRFI